MGARLERRRCATTLETLRCHIRFADDGVLVSPMLPVELNRFAVGD